MEPPHHLPTQWTPVDQEIIEDLLLVEPLRVANTCSAVGPQYFQPYPDAANLATGLQASCALSPASNSGSIAAHPSSQHPHAYAVPPEPCVELMQQYQGQRDELQWVTGGVPRGNADEMRKAKHREVQRRFMLRKKAQIKHTKQLAKELEMRHNVLQLSSEAAKLQGENAELNVQLTARGSESPILLKAQVDLVLEHQMRLVRENYEPLSTAEWSELLRKNLDDYDIISREPNFVSTGVTVMGWSDRRKQEDATLKFVMSKRFPYLDASDFMNTTWTKLWLPETHSGLFNPAVTIKIQILQEINEDTVVMHRAFFNPQTNSVVHSVETMCRIQHGHDYIVFLRSPDHSTVKPCVHELFDWVKIWTSLVFTPLTAPRRRAGPGGCVLRYGGAMHDFSPADIQYWLLEMLYVLLRFENVMVAPVFALLPPQPDSGASSLASSPCSSSG